MDLNDKPALPAPEGLNPNFIDPPTLMPTVIVTCTVVLALVTAFVCARLFIKSYIIGEHHIEDYLSYLAWAGIVTYIGVLIYIENYGFARHQWDISVAMFEHIMYYLNVVYCIYGPTTMAAKLSVLFQIKRIFAAVRKDVVYWVVVFSIVLNFFFYTGLFLSYVFQCWPRPKIWNPTVPGKCVSSTKSNLAAGILNLISDVEALLLPAWAIWHLKMPIKKKLAAYTVFGVGSIACAIGVAGIYFRVLLLEKSDFTWICTKAAMLVISEMAVVTIVGCFPSLPRLYHYLRGNKDGRSKLGITANSNKTQKYGIKRSNRSNFHGSMVQYMDREWRSDLLQSVASNERLELHRYSIDAERGGDGRVGYETSFGNGILKTTAIDQSVDASKV
ncbi:MAG: hypothetical protein M1820_010498 [Bogoriella megaspora]|nr:MAG: hypothetical protein M1820_010498 [Bogoriella megaspora]